MHTDTYTGSWKQGSSLLFHHSSPTSYTFIDTPVVGVQVKQGSSTPALHGLPTSYLLIYTYTCSWDESEEGSSPLPLHGLPTSYLLIRVKVKQGSSPLPLHGLPTSYLLIYTPVVGMKVKKVPAHCLLMAHLQATC